MRKPDAPTVEPSRVLPSRDSDRYGSSALLEIGPNAKDACGDDPVVRTDNNTTFHCGTRHNNSQTLCFFALRHRRGDRNGHRDGDPILRGE